MAFAGAPRSSEVREIAQRMPQRALLRAGEAGTMAHPLMPDHMLVASATNLLCRGFLAVPTDRRSRDGDPVNALFAVARAIHRVVAFKVPARAVAVIDANPSLAG